MLFGFEEEAISKHCGQRCDRHCANEPTGFQDLSLAPLNPKVLHKRLQPYIQKSLERRELERYAYFSR